MLSKYERVQVLAMRVKQLNAGADAAVEFRDGDSTYSIAVRELEGQCMPIRVQKDNVPDKQNERVLSTGPPEPAGRTEG
jgi:DNA-directed RNA polymerase subunit K/omega